MHLSKYLYSVAKFVDFYGKRFAPSRRGNSADFTLLHKRIIRYFRSKNY